MQYEITLPADYDMEIIRQRVQTRGHLLDSFPGLGLKAYLVRECGVAGSPVNQYAPFYLWRGPEAMNAFLWGPGFEGIVSDFGRPAVRQWTGLHFAYGPATDAPPVVAVRRRMPVPEAGQPAAHVREAAEASARLSSRDGVVCTALAVNSTDWELVQLTLWAEQPAAVTGDVYRVLHLSAPERELLPQGRHW